MTIRGNALDFDGGGGTHLLQQGRLESREAIAHGEPERAIRRPRGRRGSSGYRIAGSAIPRVQQPKDWTVRGVRNRLVELARMDANQPVDDPQPQIALGVLLNRHYVTNRKPARGLQRHDVSVEVACDSRRGADPNRPIAVFG